MLDPLFGEFLIVPIPLQLKGNYCSHECPYCYANLNNPTRKIDLNKTLNQISNISHGDNLLSRLLRDKYPVTVSNHSDPFSRSNQAILVPLMQQLTELDIPIFIQTRGGYEPAIAQTFEFLKPSVIYVSLTHSQDATRAKHEPKAPSIPHRLEFIKEAIGKGHKIIVGFNPIVPEWLTNHETLLDQLWDLGVRNIAISVMHLSKMQKQNMKIHHKMWLTPQLMKRAMSRSNRPEFAFAELVKTDVLARGFECFDAGQKEYTDFFQIFNDTYSNLFPVQQDFINHLHRQNTIFFTGTEFIQYIVNRLPQYPAITGLRSYITGNIQETSLNYRIPSVLNYRQVLEIIFEHNIKRLAPIQIDGICEVKTENGNELKDVNNYPVYAMTNHSNYYYATVDDEILRSLPFEYKY
jgi:DNA repair photolyase